MLSLTLSRKFVATAALAFAACGMASSAHARTDVTFSIGVQVPGAYGHPQQVYAEPTHVYVQPRPVYVQPGPVYVQPAPVYFQPRPVFVQPPAYGRYYGNEHGWRRAQWESVQWERSQRHGHHGHKRHGGKYGDPD